jgi:hypothetical protein
VQTAYTRWVRRTFLCCVPRCNRTAEPHHVRTKGAQGQIDEANVAPLCKHHHTGTESVHWLGARTFARRFGVCLPAQALLVYVAWLRSGEPTDTDMAF